MSVPKEYKMLVENEFPNQNIQVLSDLGTRFLQHVRFKNKFFTTRQIF